MIYPASYDITILQNATWRGVFRATQNRQAITSITIATGTPTFAVPCHKLTAGNKVVITGGTTIPCGLDLNVIYYVISTGLTEDQFQISATDGGSSISVSGAAVGNFFVASPLDLTTYTVDADITGLTVSTQIATFTPSITDATNGAFTLTLSPAVTIAIEEGRYAYDVSLTAGSGDRYYWLTGVATVQRTFSRN
jgi:hypothetical protein